MNEFIPSKDFEEAMERDRVFVKSIESETRALYENVIKDVLAELRKKVTET